MFPHNPEDLNLEYQLGYQQQIQAIEKMSPEQLEEFSKYMVFRDYMNRQVVKQIAKKDLSGLDVLFPQG